MSFSHLWQLWTPNLKPTIEASASRMGSLDRAVFFGHLRARQPPLHYLSRMRLDICVCIT